MGQKGVAMQQMCGDQGKWERKMALDRGGGRESCLPAVRGHWDGLSDLVKSRDLYVS